MPLLSGQGLVKTLNQSAMIYHYPPQVQGQDQAQDPSLNQIIIQINNKLSVKIIAPLGSE